MAQWIFQVVLSGSSGNLVDVDYALCVEEEYRMSQSTQLGQSRLRGLLISHPVFYVVTEQCGGMGG